MTIKYPTSGEAHKRQLYAALAVVGSLAVSGCAAPSNTQPYQPSVPDNSPRHYYATLQAIGPRLTAQTPNLCIADNHVSGVSERFLPMSFCPSVEAVRADPLIKDVEPVGSWVLSICSNNKDGKGLRFAEVTEQSILDFDNGPPENRQSSRFETVTDAFVDNVVDVTSEEYKNATVEGVPCRVEVDATKSVMDESVGKLSLPLGYYPHS